MTTTSTHDQQFDERLADSDRRLRSVETVIVPLRRPARPEASVRVSSMPPPSACVARPLSQEDGTREAPRVRPGRPHGAALGDLVGGRLLAWIGGVATLLGIALFLTLAISRGWIGIEARVILAGLASTSLMGAGVWLHAKRGRTEASVVLVGVATAGLFATLLVASTSTARSRHSWHCSARYLSVAWRQPWRSAGQARPAQLSDFSAA
jgi:uncharacterized membrane protein